MTAMAGVLLGACADPRASVPDPGANQQTAPESPLIATRDQRLMAPPDVQVVKFAEVSGARAMTVGPDGSIYVSQPSSGRITRIVDADDDGTPEQQSVILAGLNSPHGMAFNRDWFYVANTDAVVRFRLNYDGIPFGNAETVATYSSGGGHWTRSILFGADGMMYVSIGSSCNICEERTPDRAAVMRFLPDGGPGTVFSSGLRNAVGMALNPTTGRIWVSQNERDNIRPDHENLPPEEINILAAGEHYGWPYCHSDRVPNPEYGNEAKCRTTSPPALKIQAHSAPLGMTFLNNAAKLSPRYRGDLLVALHGSWNRDTPTGAKVIRVRVSAGRPVSYEDFITGWQQESGLRWGRPVDVAVTKGGAVLISDDQGDVIWRASGR